MKRRVMLAAILAAGTILSSAARADDAISPEARSAVEKMNKALSTDSFTFHAHTIRQFEQDGQPLHIFHDADVAVRRPDHLAIDMTGDDGTTRITYDGKTLTILIKDSNKFITVPSSGSIEAMLRDAAQRMGVDFPLADLLADQPGKSFLDGVTFGKLVDKVSIDGEPGQHFLFLQPPGIELELWTDNDTSLPRRITATYRSIPGEPQFISEMDQWQLNATLSDSDFATQVPPDATKIEPKEPSQ
jgi:hypothetical protein